MTPDEKQIISGIFDRLKQVEGSPRDPEADRLIAQRLAEQPGAAYAMAQSIYVQEQALLNMNQQIEALQAQVRDLEVRAAQPQGGFLSSLFGGPRPAPAPAPQAPAAQPMGAPMGAPGALGAAGMGRPGMPGQQPGPFGAPAPAAGPWGQAQPQQPQRGGFLGTAMATAAGVAGGMIVGNMLMNAFSGGGQAQAATNPSGIEEVPAPAAAPAAEPASWQQPEQDAGWDSGDWGSEDI